jgi:hypothetical protein
MIENNFSKIIWQTHKWEYQDLPDIYKKTSMTWQAMNPDWEYKYISNNKIRKEIEKIGIDKLLVFFDSCNTGMEKADAYREIMVYYYGGLWADMDSVCIFPIDKIIEKNQDKEMICAPPIFQFGLDPEKGYTGQDFNVALNNLTLGIQTGYWIPNGLFLGKKNNKISKEIIDSMVNEWKFKGHSLMDVRVELYEKYHDQMTLDLICAIHDGRFNDRNF